MGKPQRGIHAILFLEIMWLLKLFCLRCSMNNPLKWKKICWEARMNVVESVYIISKNVFYVKAHVRKQQRYTCNPFYFLVMWLLKLSCLRCSIDDPLELLENLLRIPYKCSRISVSENSIPVKTSPTSTLNLFCTAANIKSWYNCNQPSWLFFEISPVGWAAVKDFLFEIVHW